MCDVADVLRKRGLTETRFYHCMLLGCGLTSNASFIFYYLF